MQFIKWCQWGPWWPKSQRSEGQQFKPLHQQDKGNNQCQPRHNFHYTGKPPGVNVCKCVNVIPFPDKTNSSYLTMENSINYFNEDEPIRNTAHSDMTQPTSAPDYTLFHRVEVSKCSKEQFFTKTFIHVIFLV